MPNIQNLRLPGPMPSPIAFMYFYWSHYYREFLSCVFPTFFRIFVTNSDSFCIPKVIVYRKLSCLENWDKPVGMIIGLSKGHVFTFHDSIRSKWHDFRYNSSVTSWFRGGANERKILCQSPFKEALQVARSASLIPMFVLFCISRIMKYLFYKMGWSYVW